MSSQQQDHSRSSVHSTMASVGGTASVKNQRDSKWTGFTLHAGLECILTLCFSLALKYLSTRPQ